MIFARSTRLLVGTIAALLIAALLAGMLLASRKRRAPGIKLADGRTVELVGITTGASHKLDDPGPLDILHRVAPRPLRKALGPNFNSSFGFGSEGMALWLMCYDPALGGYASGWIDKVVALDEHGCEFKSSGIGSTGDGYHFAEVLHLPAFPRRQKNFICKLIKNPGVASNVLCELTITNPFPGPYPEWAPEPLPSTRTNGELVVRLNSPKPLNYTMTEGSEREWKLQRHVYEDATGNEGISLCKHEKAWKLTLSFLRSEKAEFSTNEMWTFENLKLPSSGTLAPSGFTNLISGRAIKLLYLAGAGTYTFSNDVCTVAKPWTAGSSSQMSTTSSRQNGVDISITTVGFNKPFAIIAHDSLWPDHELLLRLRHGDEIVATGRGATGTRERWFYPLDSRGPDHSWHTNGMPRTLDIIIQRTADLTFLVAPPK